MECGPWGHFRVPGPRRPAGLSPLLSLWHSVSRAVSDVLGLRRQARVAPVRVPRVFRWRAPPRAGNRIGGLRPIFAPLALDGVRSRFRHALVALLEPRLSPVACVVWRGGLHVLHPAPVRCALWRVVRAVAPARLPLRVVVSPLVSANRRPVSTIRRQRLSKGRRRRLHFRGLCAGCFRFSCTPRAVHVVAALGSFGCGARRCALLAPLFRGTAVSPFRSPLSVRLVEPTLGVRRCAAS